MPKIFAAALAGSALACLCALDASAQTNAGASAAANDEAAAQQQHQEMRANKMAPAGHDKMTGTDSMMAKNCKAMPKMKMMNNKECKDYMKNHPDMMKPSK